MAQVRVGLCGWGDHDLYPAGTPSAKKLSIYAQHFPVVELDSTYHAIPSAERMEKWGQQTPAGFQFVVKAYRELTGHGRGKGAPKRSWKEIVSQYREAIRPLQEQGKCSMLLFQFPPWYDCKKAHVAYIRKIRDQFQDDTLAIEFRHQSWFRQAVCERTLRFLAEERLVHVVCDEPQVGESSVPIVSVVTHPDHSLVRFHGRNQSGWMNTRSPHWRRIRYAYRYQDEELLEWVERIQKLQKKTNQVTLLFNNNSQGDALGNAKTMMKYLSLDDQSNDFSPKQLKLFK